MIRTSETHPLYLNSVRYPGSAGEIGITFCPGKKDQRAGWRRDLDADLKVIGEWGASSVVTLLEDHEINLLQVAELPTKVQQAGMSWFHLPIRDVSIPDCRFQARWAEYRHRIIDQLSRGQKVAVHCRGGLGRAGTVAALLLIEGGASNRDAVALVRQKRPGAIETFQQEAFVRGYRG